MEVFIAILVLAIATLASFYIFALWADGWLQRVDKDKYLIKSLKKQLKKGNITQEEYDNRLNPPHDETELEPIEDFLIEDKDSDLEANGKVHLAKE